MVDCHYHYSVISPLCVPSKLEDYMGDQVTHVLTHQTWDKNFEEVSLFTFLTSLCMYVIGVMFHRHWKIVPG